MSLRDLEYRAYLEGLGAVWGAWRGAEVVVSFGDVEGEYEAVRLGGVGLVDRSERDTLVMTGDDIILWLQALVTNDLMDLGVEGSGQWNCAVGTTGRMIADMRLLHIPDMLLADVETGLLDEALLGHFRRHVISEKVQLINRSAQTARIGIYGDGAGEILEKAGVFEHGVRSIADYDGTWGEIAGEDVIIQRNPIVGRAGFEIFCGVDGALAVWHALEQAGGDGVRPIGHEAFERLRIETGIPRFGVELHDKMIPLEADLYEMISFTKGCYLGQEIIARLDSLGTPARMLRRIELEGASVPSVGVGVLAEGKKGKLQEVGKVLSAIYSKALDKPIALAYIKRGHNEPGTSVEIDGVPGEVNVLGKPT